MCPCPEHFIVRPGPTGRRETIVPLIAVDQLPDWIQLAGVPRELGAEQSVGLANLGLVAGDGVGTYEVHLRADRIRAILQGNEEGNREGKADEEEEEDEQSLAPSDSVSEKGSEAQKGRANKAPASGRQEYVNKSKADKIQSKALESPQKEAGQLTKTTEKAQVESTPPVHAARAWDDESDVTSPVMPVSAAPEKQPKPPRGEPQHVDQADSKKKNPTPEPMLSASRHNTAAAAADAATAAAAAAGDKPTRKDKPIRPHLTEEMRDTRPRRAVTTASASVPRIVKDKFFGTNPDTSYCRHWCHHGTCKWGWECRYQHRMPPTQEGLREVGLKDFPTWYLLMMAGSGFPGVEGNNSNSLGLHGGGMSMDMSAMRSSINHPLINTNSLLLPHLSQAAHHHHHPADALIHASTHPQHHAAAAALAHHHPHPSPMELRLMQGRMSALLAGSTAMSNRQKLRQIKEMREMVLRSNAVEYNSSNYASLLGVGGPTTATAATYGLHQDYQYQHHQGRANLHTNASLAANAAGLSAASRRQALREAERSADAPVEIPAGVVSGGGKGDAVGSYDELEGRLSSVGSDGEGGGGGQRATEVREGKLVDIE